MIYSMFLFKYRKVNQKEYRWDPKVFRKTCDRLLKSLSFLILEFDNMERIKFGNNAANEIYSEYSK